MFFQWVKSILIIGFVNLYKPFNAAAHLSSPPHLMLFLEKKRFIIVFNGGNQ